MEKGLGTVVVVRTEEHSCTGHLKVSDLRGEDQALLYTLRFLVTPSDLYYLLTQEYILGDAMCVCEREKINCEDLSVPAAL
jgi:hypothetical protein